MTRELVTRLPTCGKQVLGILREHVGTPLSSHSHPGKRKQQDQDAVYREMLQRTSFFQKQLDEERLYGDEGLVKAFTAFYFIAKEEMAKSKVLPLLKLLEVLGAREVGSFGHRTKGSLHEIFCTIEEPVLDQIIDQISDSGCVGLLYGDVTGEATLKQMLTFFQYVNSGKSMSDFLPLTIFWPNQQVLMQLSCLGFLSNVFNNWAWRCQKLFSCK